MVVSIAVDGDRQQSPFLSSFDYELSSGGGVQLLLEMFARKCQADPGVAPLGFLLAAFCSESCIQLTSH